MYSESGHSQRESLKDLEHINIEGFSNAIDALREEAYSDFGAADIENLKKIPTVVQDLPTHYIWWFSSVNQGFLHNLTGLSFMKKLSKTNGDYVYLCQ